MFRIAGKANSESHEKSKHFRIRVGQFRVSAQEWRAKSLTTHYKNRCFATSLAQALNS